MPVTSTAHLVRKRSTIHGEGVFAARDFRRGEPVIEVKGRVLPGEAVTGGMRAMQIGPNLYLAETPGEEELDSYINHCCEPNLGFLHGKLVLHALRDIAGGEELFWHYSTSMNEPGWELPCGCGVKSCRGRIQSFCDLPEGVREELRGIALEYLR